MRPTTTQRYYLHRAAMTTGFFWPVFPLFLLDRGIGFTGIGTLLAIEAAIMLLSEVPTGFVGDTWGRRSSLLLGSGLMVVGELGFVVAHNFAAFTVVYICFGLARTFQSGSGDAWLYDILTSNNEEGTFTEIRGRGEATTHWMGALTMVASGGLYVIDPVAPFLAAAVLAGIDIVVLLTFPAADESRDTSVTSSAVVPLVRSSLTNSTIWPFVVIAAVFFGIERAVSEFIPSVTTSVLGTSVPVSTGAGSGDVVFVGLFFAGFTVTSALASSFAGRVRSWLGAPAALACTGYLSAGVMLAALVSPPFALVSFVLIKSADALLLPLVNGFVNDHVDTAGRATVLSAMSMVFTLTKIPLLITAGALADATTALTAVSGLGLFFVLVTTAVIVSTGVPADLTNRSDKQQYDG